MAIGDMITRILSWRPLGASLFAAAVFFVVGIVFWGAFNTVMEATQTLPFCISCHEMEDNVYQEYKETVHFQNRTGVRATCSDCHVPKPWIYKMIRKIQASNEVLHKVLGTIDTPEKFEAKRFQLAKNVWKAMKETDSRECRNCHSWDSMKQDKQKKRAWKNHQLAQADNMTCIDCHKGIAHRDVSGLLREGEDAYDGKAGDDRHLPPKEKKPTKGELKAAADAQKAEEAKKAAAAAPAPKAAAASGGGSAEAIAWDGVEGKDITLLYPGIASLEWVYKGSDHGGARAIKKLDDRCTECHEGEQEQMGAKIVSGEKAEPTPIPGKRGHIKANVKAANDGTNLYMRFEWDDAGHTPVPFVDGGKMDPANQIKLAVMFDDGKVEKADHAGCWATCHHDSRYMPDHPKDQDAAKAGITKYLLETKTEWEVNGNDGVPRGAWDKARPQAEIDGYKKDGVFLDLVRYKSGDKKTETGYVLDKRVMEGGAKSTITANLVDGKWVAFLTRPLKASDGFVSFEKDKLYTMGFAIHDDFTNARFHHVSLEYKVGIDNAEADVNAATIAAPAGGTVSAAPAADAATPAAASSSGGGSIDFSKATAKEITFLYPGQASLEWVYKGSDHGGARAIKKLDDRCTECHEGEQEQMGAKIVSGEKAEPTPIPGKRGHIKVSVKAVNDGENLHMQFQWPDVAHAPVPFVDGGKMDPANQIKFAMMIDDDKVEKATHAGCWATCHHDSRYMPDHPKDQDAAKAGVTKYLLETKTEWEVNGNDGKPRGAWDKAKPQGDIDGLKSAGQFMDLTRFLSGNGGVSESGVVLDKRDMTGGQSVEYTGTLADGVWTVTMKRPLKAANGLVSLEPGKLYTVGFAIHDDYTTARFHHVSLEYKLGIDNGDAEINAIKN